MCKEMQHFPLLLLLPEYLAQSFLYDYLFEFLNCAVASLLTLTYTNLQLQAIRVIMKDCKQ